MLYDPKWEVKTDPFTLESLIAWLEQQPAADTYDFFEWDGCLLARWLQTMDPAAHVAGHAFNGYAYTVNGKEVDLHKFRSIAFDAAGNNYTFGDALARARKLSEQTSC